MLNDILKPNIFNSIYRCYPKISIRNGIASKACRPTLQLDRNNNTKNTRKVKRFIIIYQNMI